MSYSTTQVIGFAESVIEFIRNSSQALAGMGINADAWVIDLEQKKGSAVTLNDEQEKMKASLREQTGRTEGALGILYDTASSRLDAVMGTLGKKSEVGKQAARLRSKIKGPARKKED